MIRSKGFEDIFFIKVRRNILEKEELILLRSDNFLKVKIDGRRWCYRIGFVDNNGYDRILKK